MVATEEVRLKTGEKAFAHKEDGGVVFTTLNRPVVLTRWQLWLILFLLIFIVLFVIMMSIFNAMYLHEVGKAILQKLDEVGRGLFI